MRRRIEPERQHFGIGRRLVGPAERLNAGLHHLGRQHAAVTVDRTEVAKSLRRTGRWRGEIIARHRDGEIGAQAQLAAVGVGGEVHALADVLAREVEERLGRLQDRRRDAAIAGALIGADQRFGPCVGLRCRRCSCHNSPSRRGFSRVWAGI